MSNSPFAPLPRWIAALSEPRQKTRPGHTLSVERWNIPFELRTHDSWAVWKYSADSQGRISKPPYQPDGAKAEASEPETWATFDDAYETYRHGGWDGVSFALSPRWGLVGIDLDHVSEHGREADQIVRALNSYTERSPGGDGLRIFVKGSLPLGRRRRDWVEAYVTRRFLTVTGQHLDGTPKTINANARGLERVFWQYLGADAESIKRSMRT
jgi:primase-polymerase (primpol)-like protein